MKNLWIPAFTRFLNTNRHPLRLKTRQVARRPANPCGNAHPYGKFMAESFMKTLKTEEVNGKACKDIEEARRDIGAFIEDVYNMERLHSAPGYKPPVEFEAGLRHPSTRPNGETGLSLN